MPTQNTGIALANELADLAKNEMFDFEVLILGAEIVEKANTATQDEIMSLLFKYSATLTAGVATRITHTILSESQIKEMMGEIQMFEDIEKEVMGG